MIILIIHTVVSYDQNIYRLFLWKWDSMSGCDIRLVFTFPPKDSTLQYKKCVHFGNSFSCINTLYKTIFKLWPIINTLTFSAVRARKMKERRKIISKNLFFARFEWLCVMLRYIDGLYARKLIIDLFKFYTFSVFCIV